MLEMILLSFGLIFPAAYIFYKGGNDKFLFIASCIGVLSIVEVLILIVLHPFMLLSLFILPQLDAYGYLNNIEYLISGGTWIAINAIGGIALLAIPLTIAVYNKYEMFRNDT